MTPAGFESILKAIPSNANMFNFMDYTNDGTKEHLTSYQQLATEERKTVTGGEGQWTWLGRYWGILPVSDGPLQEEGSPRIEFHLPKAKYRGRIDLAQLLERLLSVRPSVEQAAITLVVLLR